MKYALFDCDGTLMDSMPMWVNLATDVLRGYGVELPRNIERETASMSHKDAAKFFADRFLNGEGAEALLQSFSQTLEKNYGEILALKPTVKEVLEKMYARHIPMAVASSTDENLLELGLQRVGIRSYFSFVQTVDNTGFSKDSDEYFQQAAKRLGCVCEDIIFFDDALYAIERAKKNGLTVVGVQDDSNIDQDAQIRAAADHYITRFEEIDLDAWF